MKSLKKWLCFAVLIPGIISGQFRVQEGQIVDSVPVADQHTLSYYIPSVYGQKKAWPVLFVFDPAARAHKAVETFASAGEKYGYIIISSDAIKNGSYQENYRHARDLFQKADELFHLDSLNQYTAGFSGGGRLAMAIAGLSKEINAVISGGAGLTTVSENWLRSNAFVFIGMCGDEDFNYSEMKFTEKVFQELKYPNEIIWFEGEHEWPSQGVAEKAVRDLSVLMFSRRQQKYTEEELMRFYDDQIAYNKELQQNGHWLWAYKDLEKMRDWYQIYGRDREIKDMQKEIRRNRLYRTQRDDNRYVDEVEALYMQEYVGFLVQDIRAGDLEALGYWDQELKQLDKSFTESKKTAEQKMATRIKAMLSVVAAQAKSLLKEPEGYEQLLFVNIFMTLLDENDQEAYLEAMRLAVATGDYDIALYYTDQLLEIGFDDIERLRNYPGITLLRIQPEFGEVLEKHGFESRF